MTPQLAVGKVYTLGGKVRPGSAHLSPSPFRACDGVTASTGAFAGRLLSVLFREGSPEGPPRLQVPGVHSEGFAQGLPWPGLRYAG